MKVLGLIPTRLNSTRLPQKALLPINKIPLVIHTYKRAKLSKKISDVYIFCDDQKIKSTAKKFGAKVLVTSKNHKNGTERINEAYKKLKKKYDLIVDIQGDEPLISPYHIDKVVNYHIKTITYDLILPTLQIKPSNTTTLVKVILNNNKSVMYISSSHIPLSFPNNQNQSSKHFYLISFSYNLSNFIIILYFLYFFFYFCRLYLYIFNYLFWEILFWKINFSLNIG